MEKYNMPPVLYGWPPQYAELGRRIKLRPGQSFAQIGRMADVPDEIYLSGIGITHLIQNPGQSVEATASPAKRAVMINGEGLIDQLKAYYSTTDIKEWEKADAKATTEGFVDEEFNIPARKSGFVLDEVFEKLGYKGVSGELQAKWNESEANETFSRALQLKVTSIDSNGKYYGGYDGHLAGDRITVGINGLSIEAGRKILKWEEPITLYPPNGVSIQVTPEDAVKRLTPFQNTFYSKSAHVYRHGSIKIYGKGEADIFKMAMGFLLGFEIDRIARQQLNIPKRVAVVAFPGYNETLRDTDPNNTRADYEIWAVRYARTFTVAGGTGVVVRPTFPMWSYSIQIGLYFLAFAMDFDFYSWEAAERFGRNETVVPITEGQNAYEGVTYNGSPTTHAQSIVAGEYAPDRNVMYPANPQGCMDLPLVAADMYTFINQYAGFEGEWTRHRVRNESDGTFGAFTQFKPDYLIDRYEAVTNPSLISPGIAMRFVQENRRGLFYINMHLPAGKWEYVEVDLGGVYHQFRAYGGVPYCFRRGVV